MLEQNKPLPIEDCVNSLAIPSEAIPLNEMIQALVVEEQALGVPFINIALREARIARGLTQKQLGEIVERDVAESVIERSLQDAIELALGLLNSRASRVIRLRFGLGDDRQRTLLEIGEEFSVTPERIRQIESKALRNLRHPSRAKSLMAYYEYYVKKDTDRSQTEEALLNGVVNAIHQKDFNRAQDNLAKIEKKEMDLAGLEKKT